MNRRGLHKALDLNQRHRRCFRMCRPAWGSQTSKSYPVELGDALDGAVVGEEVDDGDGAAAVMAVAVVAVDDDGGGVGFVVAW